VNELVHKTTDRILAQHSRADQDCIGAARTIGGARSGSPVEKSLSGFRESEYARFRQSDAKLWRGSARRGELNLSSSHAKRRDSGEE
jgi:hypothetical protein